MPIRQKVRPLLLLRKQLGHFQRVGTNTLAIGNRLQGIGTGPGQTGLRALSLAATVGSDDVTVNFNEDVVVTDPASGVTITVNGQAATFTAVKGTRSMVYTLTSQNPLDYDDLVVWTYDSAAAGGDPYTGQDSGEVLADSSLTRKLPTAPPVITEPVWGAVTLPSISVGGNWSSVNLNSFITDDGGESPVYGIASGTIPNGITLNPNGTFSGTATDPGTDTVSFSATNSGGSANSTPAGWTVNAVVTAPVWGTVILPTVDVGDPWTINLDSFITDDGGESPTYAVVAGDLPAGITLNPGGTFSGTATTPDTGTATFSATNSGGSNNSNAAGWTVNPAAGVGAIAGWTGLENCA